MYFSKTDTKVKINTSVELAQKYTHCIIKNIIVKDQNWENLVFKLQK